MKRGYVHIYMHISSFHSQPSKCVRLKAFYSPSYHWAKYERCFNVGFRLNRLRFINFLELIDRLDQNCQVM